MRALRTTYEEKRRSEMSEHKRVFEELAEARANLKKASDKAYGLIDELVKSPIGIKEPTVTGLLLGYWANGS